MRVERLRAGGEPAEIARDLRALVPGGASVAATVAAIIDDVRVGGDEAVRRHTERLDTRGAPAPALRATAADLQAALEALPPELRAGLALANANVGRVAAAQLHGESVVDFGSHQVTTRSAPVRRAAVYVPGGRAPYPSTVVMGVATARAAGVGTVAVCSPPGPDGRVAAAILAACALTGADEVYRIGGAQAIAALALGTEAVTAVDVIVGPGNLYVQEAKRQLSGAVGIDSFAGPSDLLAIADGSTDPGPLALDLLAQAEHGSGTLVVCASPDGELLTLLEKLLGETALETEAVCRLVEIPGFDYALALAEEFAPEHLELLGPLAAQLAPGVTRAGCVFLDTGTAFGDYVAGSNHTLPTSGAAAFASGLGPQHFRRVLTEVRIPDPDPLARAAAPIARAEGFELHARSMEVRIRENGSP